MLDSVDGHVRVDLTLPKSPKSNWSAVYLVTIRGVLRGIPSPLLIVCDEFIFSNSSCHVQTWFILKATSVWFIAKSPKFIAKLSLGKVGKLLSEKGFIGLKYEFYLIKWIFLWVIIICYLYFSLANSSWAPPDEGKLSLFITFFRYTKGLF